MRTAAVLVAWACVVATGIGFVTPWARIDLLNQTSSFSDTLTGLTKDIGRITAKIRRGAETITGDLPSLSDIPKEVSGIQIPQLANQKNAQTAIALMELFTGQRQQIGLKSYAVYLLPGIALLCGLLLTLLGRQRVVPWAVAGLCALIAGVGFWKLLTTNLSSLMIAITIGPGLWLSLWAYVGLAAAAALTGVLSPKRA